MLNKHTKQIFFAAMNTPFGFRSCFNEIFSKLRRLYIIKGGPGTGKSRLMREISVAAQDKGFAVEEFLCSSDPLSLDGVIIPELSIGIIDGTPPHTYDPKTPGAVENIIDLGRFWNSFSLHENYDEISALSQAKTRLYSSVYSYLAAISECDMISSLVMKSSLICDKLEHFVKREAEHLTKDTMPERTIRIRSAISCDGHITLASFADMSENRRVVLDCAGSGRVFMTQLLAETERIGVSSVVSLDPLRPDTPDAIYYPSSDIVYYVGSESDYEEKTINMRRFLDNKRLSPFKSKLRALSHIKTELSSQMQADFRSIKRLHSELEHIYARAMDFERKEQLRDKLIKEIFGE